ncbi:MAG: hypothetical protein JSS65_12310 [Armatimonadetes bacterium]|nr:hypothetical protein [Armatimonadota bacterium]
MNPVLLHQTGLTLLHFIWQGALIAGSLSIAMRFVPTRRADIRYGMALAALAALCVCPLVTYASLQGQSLPVPAPVADTAETSFVTQEGAELILSDASAPAVAPSALPFDLPTAATVVWAIGVCFLVARLAAGLWRAHLITRRRTAKVPDSWQERLAVLAEELGIKRSVRLIASELIDAPATVGILKAVVLVPCSFLSKLPEEMVEALLLHELAHIRRHDYLLNIVQTVAETVLFYHPAVWWVSHVVRAERENCCDDIAVGATGDSASYAKALTMLEERRTMALAVSASGGHLMKRIRRILSINTSAEPAPAARPAAIIVTIMALALAATVLANTGDKKPKDTDGPDVKIDREDKPMPTDYVALAPSAGDIGKIGDTVKESDYKGAPVPVVKLDVVPGFFQTGERVRPGQALRTTYAVAGKGTVVVFADGRPVTTDGVKTEVVTAVPSDPAGTSYVVSLPGRFFAPDEKIRSGQTTYISVEPSDDGSYIVLRAVEPTRGRTNTQIKLEGDDWSQRKAVSAQGLNVALVAPRAAAPSARVVTLHPSAQEAAAMARPSRLAPVAVPSGTPVDAIAPVAQYRGTAVATPAIAPRAGRAVNTGGVALAAPAAAGRPAALGGTVIAAPTGRATSLGGVALAAPAASSRTTALGGNALAAPAASGSLGGSLSRTAAGPVKAAPAAKSGVPILSDVPIVDRLFTTQDKAKAAADAVAQRDKYVRDYAVAKSAVQYRDAVAKISSDRVAAVSSQQPGRVSLLAEAVPLSQVVRELVLQSEISVLIEPGDYQKVTLFSRNLEPEEALALAVRAAKGELRREGKTWIVSPRSGAPVRDKAAGPVEKTANINLKDVAFTTAIENMAKLYGFNYSIDTDMGPISVNAKVDNANLSTALKAVCRNIVHYRVEDGTYHFGVLKG